MAKITQKEHIPAQDAQEEQVPVSPADPEQTPTPDPEPTEPTEPAEPGITLPDEAAPVEQLADTDRLLAFDTDGTPLTATAQQLKEYATEGLASTEALNEALAGKADAPPAIRDGDLNEFVSNGLYVIDGGGLTNAPVTTLNCRVLVIAGNPGRVTQIAQVHESDRIFFRRKIDAMWQPWRELYHSGNFDAPSSLKYLGRGALLDKWNVGHGFTERGTPIGGSSSFLCFGMPGYRIEIALGGYSSWQDGWNRIFFRSQDGDSGKVSDWKEFYHSGNLTPATAASVGLMSAADKVKLNAVASAMALSEDAPATLALDDEKTVSPEVSIRAQRSAQYQMQTDELLYDALEAFARNHPEYTEFAEWIAAKDRIRAELAKPETINLD